MRSLALTVLISSLAAPAAAQPSWYDASDLVATLRSSERSSIAAQAGGTTELPLYELTIELAGDLRSFELDETIWFTNRAGRPISSVVLRIFANAVGEPGERPLVDLVEGECLDGVDCQTQQTSPSAIVVRPEQAIAPDGRLRIHVRLRGRLREIAAERASMAGQSMEALSALMGGHGEGGDYGLLAYSEGLASMSYFFPILARMRGGHWEGSDSSTIGDLGNDELGHVRARIRTADGVRVAASGVVAAPRVAGDRREHVVTAGFIRDFGLVASPRLRARERRVGDVTVRSVFLEGDGAAGERVLDAAAQALTIFTRRFGPYPYTELDVAEAPLVGGAGGVELSGFVTVASMFYRPMSAGSDGGLMALLGSSGDMEARRLASLDFVTAHEVAHQWWHGLVGSDSRRDPFQDECLAQYSAMLYVAERYGEERARREADQQVAAGYHMMRLMGREDAAVARPAAAFGDMLTYGGLVYGKGPFMYPALRALLGDRAFFAALRDYVREHRFRTAPPRALFDGMARGTHADAVRAIERRWLDEAHGDEDLGQPDLGRMLGASGGGGNDAATQMLQQLLGQGAQGGDSGELMRGLMQMLGE